MAAVNDLGAPDALARLLARDSVHGHFPVPVSVEHDTMMVGASPITMLMEPHAEELPWRELGIDVVISPPAATAGTRRRLTSAPERGPVIISAPAKDADATFVIGVNEDTFDPGRDFVVSNASCLRRTRLAVLAKVLDDAFGMEQGFDDDRPRLHGRPAPRRCPAQGSARSHGAAINIVPTTTGAARATGLVMPDVAGRLDGLSLRVPVPDGSITDLVAVVRATPAVEDICAAYWPPPRAGGWRVCSSTPRSSSYSTDIVGSSASCIFDSKLTMASGSLVKVLGWYDNEMGYSSRLVDLATVVGGTGDH